MRTKTTLAAAAILAAGLVSSMAQANVYSLNIVGYVNVPVTSGKLALLNNPLIPPGGNNAISNVLTLANGSDATTVFAWNKGTASWDSINYIDGFGWDAPANLPVGSGFFISPTLSQTITFVGDVQTGTSTNVITGGLSLLGSKVPVAGPQPGSTVGNDADSIFTWDAVGQGWVSANYILGFGWDTASINGPVVGVAEGFFYQNTGGTVNWITTLNP
jgi:hypothetical protein